MSAFSTVESIYLAEKAKYVLFYVFALSVPRCARDDADWFWISNDFSEATRFWISRVQLSSDLLHNRMGDFSQWMVRLHYQWFHSNLSEHYYVRNDLFVLIFF